MKEVKRKDLKIGNKYLIEAELEFIRDNESSTYPLLFSFNKEDTSWFSNNITIRQLQESEEESPKYLKNVINKLKELDKNDRNTWLNQIINEFGDDLKDSLKREKVKLTREQADDFEKAKSYTNSLSEILSELIFGNDELYARAWLDGYYVEEPLYWVRDKYGCAMLYKTPKGNITSTYYDVNYEQQNSKKERYTFTEKEIKDYDKRYWTFAVPVEE